MLRATAVEPIIPKKLPPSVKQLLIEHNNKGWNKLRLADKKHWAGPVRTRYSRRQGLFEAIERKAQMLRSPSDVAARMLLAAEAMDKERGSVSMSNYANSLRKKAPGYKERVSKHHHHHHTKKKARVEAEEASEI